MNIEEYRNYCLGLAGVTEEFPFGAETLVFKVMNKMFALTNIDDYDFINLKCDPDRAVILREQYEGITPGWHMTKLPCTESTGVCLGTESPYSKIKSESSLSSLLL